MEGIRKGYLFWQKWYIKGGKRLDLGAEPPCGLLLLLSEETFGPLVSQLM